MTDAILIIYYRNSGPHAIRWRVMDAAGDIVHKAQCLEAAYRHAESLVRIGLHDGIRVMDAAPIVTTRSPIA